MVIVLAAVNKGVFKNYLSILNMTGYSCSKDDFYVYLFRIVLAAVKRDFSCERFSGCS